MPRTVRTSSSRRGEAPAWPRSLDSLAPRELFISGPYQPLDLKHSRDRPASVRLYTHIRIYDEYQRARVYLRVVRHNAHHPFHTCPCHSFILLPSLNVAKTRPTSSNTCRNKTSHAIASTSGSLLASSFHTFL